jgi:thiosulfate/3-mercaptopyruvate sulfurtransferase
MPSDPVISAHELLASLREPRRQNLALLDCRAGPKARADYQAGHLPGAHFADLETDLAAPTPTPERGGRHPLPTATAFAAQLGRWGIDGSTRVVAYDDQGGANAAARLWWMLRALGHREVQVLDGGLQAAIEAGCALTPEVPQLAALPAYPATAYAWPLASLEETDVARLSPQRGVLDVRAAFRFRGESEPIDPIAGHIPGAHNIPFAENLEHGRFKSAEALRALYVASLRGLPPESWIVHCGSGVTACHSLLALERAGLPGAKLYIGSWGEWCRRPELPREP